MATGGQSLRCLSRRGEGDELTEVSCRDACDVVVAALRANSALAIHRRGSAVLVKLLQLRGRGAAVISDDACAQLVDCIRDSMRRHSEDVDVVGHGVCAVRCLSEGVDYARSLAVDRGCVDAIVDAMLCQTARSPLGSAVCRFVETVVGGDGGEIDREFRDVTPSLRLAAVRLIARLCCSSDPGAVFGDSVTAWLVDIARVHCSERDLQMDVCRVLAKLAAAPARGDPWCTAAVVKCASDALLACKGVAADADECLHALLALVSCVMHSEAGPDERLQLASCCYDVTMHAVCATMHAQCYTACVSCAERSMLPLVLSREAV